MFIDDHVIHELVSDYLNQNPYLSKTEIVEIKQNVDFISVVVLSGELGKVKRKFGVDITFTELEI